MFSLLFIFAILGKKQKSQGPHNSLAYRIAKHKHSIAIVIEKLQLKKYRNTRLNFTETLVNGNANYTDRKDRRTRAEI